MNFWVIIVYGTFGSWKTYGTLLQLYQQSKDNTFIISNNPYGKVDLYFSTEVELLKVIDLLEEYMQQTNRSLLSYFTNSSSYKDIVFVIDEAHLYFDSRHALTNKNNMERLGLLLTQCRKRKVKFYVVTQRLTNIDIRIRRLADFVEEYKRNSFLWLIKRVRKKTYENLGDIGDLESDTVVRFVDGEQITAKKEALISSELFRPLTTFLNVFIFLSYAYRELIKEEYLTYHVVGFEDTKVNLEYYETPWTFIKALVVEEKKKFTWENWTLEIIESDNLVLQSLSVAVEESRQDENWETPAYQIKQQKQNKQSKILLIKK